MNMHAPRPQSGKTVMTENRVSLIGALMVLLGPVSMSLFTPAMPQLVEVFGTTESMVKMTLSAYFAGFAITQLVCGPLSDAYGRKPVTLAFMVIYVAASALSVFAPTVELLIGARFLQGVGAAVGVAVSRALVRDLFTGEASNRIMNLTGLLMGLGPALAPTVGGLLLEFTGWRSIFVFMLVAGIFIAATIQIVMVETVTRDPRRFRPKALARSYATLLTDKYFMLASMVLAGGIGAFYTQATLMPFILMNRAGLSPSEFGLAMLLQSGPFFVGGLIFRSVMARFSARRLIPLGIAFIAVGHTAMVFALLALQPSVVTVMLPVACFTFGVAFIVPALSTATVAPFPHMAGAASAMSSFLQMAGGFLGGIIAAAIGDPVIGMAIVVPLMGWGAILCWLLWRRLPEPALARVVLPQPEQPDQQL
jgi:DHA1 family bicyclomycin/chloramphenicol resistance-like MFS transporter